MHRGWCLGACVKVVDKCVDHNSPYTGSYNTIWCGSAGSTCRCIWVLVARVVVHNIYKSWAYTLNIQCAGCGAFVFQINQGFQNQVFCDSNGCYYLNPQMLASHSIIVIRSLIDQNITTYKFRLQKNEKPETTARECSLLHGASERLLCQHRQIIYLGQNQHCGGVKEKMFTHAQRPYEQQWMN